MTRRIALALAALTLTLTGCADADDWTRGYPPCAQEDSPGPCYWDAERMGNGQGQSFVVHADQTVEYIDR